MYSASQCENYFKVLALNINHLTLRYEFYNQVDEIYDHNLIFWWSVVHFFDLRELLNDYL
jgi:hypothetical protein